MQRSGISNGIRTTAKYFAASSYNKVNSSLRGAAGMMRHRRLVRYAACGIAVLLVVAAIVNINAARRRFVGGKLNIPQLSGTTIDSIAQTCKRLDAEECDARTVRQLIVKTLPMGRQRAGARISVIVPITIPLDSEEGHSETHYAQHEDETNDASKHVDEHEQPRTELSGSSEQNRIPADNQNVAVLETALRAVFRMVSSEPRIQQLIFAFDESQTDYFKHFLSERMSHIPFDHDKLMLVAVAFDNNSISPTELSPPPHRSAVPLQVSLREISPSVDAANTTASPTNPLLSRAARLMSRAAAVATGEYLAFLACDTAPRSDWAAGLLLPFEQSGRAAVDQGDTGGGDIGLVGGLVVGTFANLYRPGVYSAGVDFAESHPDGVVGYHRLKGFFAGDKRSLNATDVPCVAADSFMIPRRLWNEVGGVDVDSYSTAQDAVVDLCMRLHRRAQRITAALTNDTMLAAIGYFTERRIVYSPNGTAERVAAVAAFTENTTSPGIALSAAVRERWGDAITRLVRSRYAYPDLNVTWRIAACCSGLFIEGQTFVYGLERRMPVRLLRHTFDCFCRGDALTVSEAMTRLMSKPPFEPEMVWFVIPYMFEHHGYVPRDLPPTQKPTFLIGRGMVETTSLSAQRAWAVLLADQVWVPARFLLDVYIGSGVPAKKLVVVPEPIDVWVFDPELHAPMKLPGDPPTNTQLAKADKHSSSDDNDSNGNLSSDSKSSHGGSTAKRERSKVYTFLSQFKWEARKNPEMLLRAYFEEFDADEPVRLVLHTYLYHDEHPRDPLRVAERVADVAAELEEEYGYKRLPKWSVITDYLDNMQVPRLFKAADCFVLPSHGEGWGLPIIQAMSMGLPAIATNWSGNTDFMTPDTSYLIEVEEFIPTEKGIDFTWDTTWAQPSKTHLRQLMRHVFENQEEAREKGRRAREHVVNSYSIEKVTEILVERLGAIREEAITRSVERQRRIEKAQAREKEREKERLKQEQAEDEDFDQYARAQPNPHLRFYIAGLFLLGFVIGLGLILLACFIRDYFV